MCAFAIVWGFVFARIRPRTSAPPTPVLDTGAVLAVNVLVVSGIWPPDVGGPASHAPDVAAFLRERGHDVEVVTTAARAPAARGVSGALGLALAAEGR